MIILGKVSCGHVDGPNATVNNWLESPNSAGGAGVYIYFHNDTEKTIKYIYFTVIPYNAVKDQIFCSISGKSELRLSYTGPVEPNRRCHAFWENCWYNNTAHSVTLTQIEIEYMDGSNEVLRESDIRYGKAAAVSCYVATAVYGSYDCPQVWTLRRFRDNTLAESWYGRAFIRTYYAVSPTLVRWFGETKWFQRLWRGPLDRLVDRLQSEGVENTPYNDRPW